MIVDENSNPFSKKRLLTNPEGKTTHCLGVAWLSANCPAESDREEADTQRDSVGDVATVPFGREGKDNRLGRVAMHCRGYTAAWPSLDVKVWREGRMKQSWR